jgi:hypothetical protein
MSSTARATPSAGPPTVPKVDKPALAIAGHPDWEAEVFNGVVDHVMRRKGVTDAFVE